MGRRRAARVRRHLENCASCGELQQDLAGLSRWVEGLGGLQEMAPEGFVSVRLAVRARLRAGSPSQERSLRPVWPILAPLAGVVFMAAVLLTGGVARIPPGPVPAMGADDGKMIHISSLEEASAALLTIQNGPDAVHRVAVSFQGPQFTHARIFQITGDRWIDSTPDPAPGQVIFYRVD